MGYKARLVVIILAILFVSSMFYVANSINMHGDILYYKLTVVFFPWGCITLAFIDFFEKRFPNRNIGYVITGKVFLLWALGAFFAFFWLPILAIIGLLFAAVLLNKSIYLFLLFLLKENKVKALKYSYALIVLLLPILAACCKDFRFFQVAILMLVLGILEYTGEKYLKSQYLFSWDSIPGNDNEKLLRYLRDNLNIDWAEKAEIRKSRDGKTIYLFKGDNTAEIMLDAEKEKATLKINGGNTDELTVKKEDGMLNLYTPKSGIIGIFHTVYGMRFINILVVLIVFLLYYWKLFEFFKDQHTLYWFYSTIVQAFAAILGIVAMFGVFLLQKDAQQFGIGIKIKAKGSSKLKISKSFSTRSYRGTASPGWDKRTRQEFAKGLKGFTILFILIILLSFVGMMIKLYPDFTAFDPGFHLVIIMNSRADIQNLLGVAFFEFTFLLIPAALMYLYALIVDFLDIPRE